MSTRENRKGPRKRGYWPSPIDIARQIPNPRGGSVCFELGATGSIHAGSLRALYFAEQVQRTAAMVGRDLRFILRLNDLAPVKCAIGGNPTYSDLGLRIAADIRGDDGLTILEKLREELQTIYERTGWKPPELMLVSDIYRSDRFVRSLKLALFESDKISEVLSEFKRSPVSFYSPICPHCRRIRSSQPIKRDFEETTWDCRACDTTYIFSPSSSLGLVTFKLEQALVWQFCSTVVDVHGQDHIEAFDASCALVRALELEFLPLAGRVNLVTNPHGEKLSKSRNNFRPVANLPEGAFQALISRYEETPYWRPMISYEDG